ncbi:kinase-like protein [Clavulina sp. PMI_390]|nr:kinase-like protein [Clavulina sp. PMI_390]
MALDPSDGSRLSPTSDTAIPVHHASLSISQQASSGAAQQTSARVRKASEPELDEDRSSGRSMKKARTQSPHNAAAYATTVLARFGISPGYDLSQLSSGDATVLLDQIYTHLQNHAPGSDEYPHILRLLQDCSFYTGALPTAFILKNVVFDRKDRLGRGGDVIVYQGRMGRQSVVVRETVIGAQGGKGTLDLEVVQLVHREAITHRQLQHPNILPFLGIHREDDSSYPLTILPFVERGSLDDMLAGLDRDVLIGLPDFVKILVGCSRGLVYLHSRTPPIVHGDLHPGNVLIGGGINPLLCDFGRSRIRHDVSRGLTNHKDLEGGRLRFLAPELWDSQSDHFCPTQASDVFALAMMYLNVWSNQLPFAEITINRQVTAALNGGLRPLEPTKAVSLDPETRENFWKLLGNMWAHQTIKRPSGNHVLEQLELIFYQFKNHYPSGDANFQQLHSNDSDIPWSPQLQQHSTSGIRLPDHNGMGSFTGNSKYRYLI